MRRKDKPLITRTANRKITQRIGSGARAVALAAAGVVIAGLASPLPAGAAPAPGVARAETAFRSDSPLAGVGLSIDLDAGLDLASHGVQAAGIGGAAEADGGITLTGAKGNKISYDRKHVTGGKVRLKGGIKLSKGAKKITINNLAADITTGAITAKVGPKAGVRIGTEHEPHDAGAIKPQGTTNLALGFAGAGINLDAGFVAAIDAALGTNVSADVEPAAGVDVEAGLEVNVDLAIGAKVNADLIVALGLDDVIDPGIDIDGLLDLDVDVRTTLN